MPPKCYECDEDAQKTLLNKPFVLICIASLLFFMSYHLLSPVLPLYWDHQHLHGSCIGMLLGSFMLASLLFRPWVGKWSDEGSRKRLMLIGIIVFSICPLLYLWTKEVAMLHAIRILHGASFALFYTASSSYLTDILPPLRKAEGISYYSNAIKLAMAFSPGLGILLAQANFMPQTFWLACVLALCSVVCIAWLPKHIHNHQHKPTGKLFNPKAFLPGLIMATNAAAFGALIPFATFIAAEKHIGLNTVVWFYTVYAVFLILSRWFTGRLSDQYGRDVVLMPGLAMVAVSLLLLYWAPSDLPFLLATALYGLSAGTVQPSLMALAADKAAPQERGSMMATFTMLSDLGIGLGSLAMGSLSNTLGYHGAFIFVIAAAITGWLLFGFTQRQAVVVFPNTQQSKVA